MSCTHYSGSNCTISLMMSFPMYVIHVGLASDHLIETLMKSYSLFRRRCKENPAKALIFICTVTNTLVQLWPDLGNPPCGNEISSCMCYCTQFELEPSNPPCCLFVSSKIDENFKSYLMCGQFMAWSPNINCTLIFWPPSLALSHNTSKR